MKFFRYVLTLAVFSLLWCDLSTAEAKPQSRSASAKWQQKRQTRGKSRYPTTSRRSSGRSYSRGSRRKSTKRASVNRGASRNHVQKVAQVPAQSQPVGTQLVIPDIYVDAPVMRGLDDIALQDGPGHDTYSDLPGQPGNCVIAAHRNVWGAWFWHLPNLKKGALIELRTPERSYQYRVVQTLTVHDSDTSVLNTPNDPSISRLTLYTCTKPRTASRFVVIADLVSNAPVDKRLIAQPIWLRPRATSSLPYKIVAAKSKRATAPVVNQPKTGPIDFEELR
jgi:sortase A